MWIRWSRVNGLCGLFTAWLWQESRGKVRRETIVQAMVGRLGLGLPSAHAQLLQTAAPGPTRCEQSPSIENGVLRGLHLLVEGHLYPLFRIHPCNGPLNDLRDRPTVRQQKNKPSSFSSC